MASPVVWFEVTGQDADKNLVPRTQLPQTLIAVVADPEGRAVGLSQSNAA